ncbi:MAG: zf-HC2 domain-containing protein [Pirellulales bacterium]|nr:zf-HC2 domain-containing protein [Pirellulales bacterium]
MNHCYRLDDFLDRDLPVRERLAFEEHLPDCAACRSAVAEYRQLYASLATWDGAENGVMVDDSTEVLAARIRSQLPKTPIARIWERPAGGDGGYPKVRRSVFPWIAAAAIVLVAVAFTFLVMDSGNRRVNVPRSPGETRGAGTDSALAHTDGSVSPQPESADMIAQSTGSDGSIRLPVGKSWPSLVKQVGKSPYDQLPVKSNNPAVTIVWLMEPLGSTGEKRPRP